MRKKAKYSKCGKRESLVVQRLGIHALTAQSPGSSPVGGIKVLQAVWPKNKVWKEIPTKLEFTSSETIFQKWRRSKNFPLFQKLLLQKSERKRARWNMNDSKLPPDLQQMLKEVLLAEGKQPWSETRIYRKSVHILPSCTEGVREGKIWHFIFLILNSSQDNCLFKAVTVIGWL